jgi:hypothetical protein
MALSQPQRSSVRTSADAGGVARRLKGRRITTTRTELFLPPRLPLDTWREIGEELSVLWDASTWWQGDWLLYGQDRYPDRYQCALENSGLDYQTLRNYAWVARKFPPFRRRPSLSMQHHAEVASLSEEEQDHWLDRAETGRWSRNKLRTYLREGQVGERGAPDGKLVIKTDPGRRQRWVRAAERRGQDLTSWVTHALDRATESVLAAAEPVPAETPDDVERSTISL